MDEAGSGTSGSLFGAVVAVSRHEGGIVQMGHPPLDCRGCANGPGWVLLDCGQDWTAGKTRAEAQLRGVWGASFRSGCRLPCRPWPGQGWTPVFPSAFQPGSGQGAVYRNARGLVQARMPVTTSPLTSSRGWLRWLYTIVSGLMPTEW